MQDILDRIWENSTLMKDEREKQPERFFSYWQPAAVGLITFSASILVCSSPYHSKTDLFLGHTKVENVGDQYSSTCSILIWLWAIQI